MKSEITCKQIHNLKYYTGSHPDIKAHFRAGKRPTEFGNKIWATSLVLIDYLHQSSLLNEGLRVLEIGCGWGLIGAYLAKNHSCQVTCTDLDPYVLPIVQLHAELNQVLIQTRQAAFTDLDEDFLRDFDLIVGAEVCYSSEVSDEILALMNRAFAAKVKHILIADPGRPDFEELYSYCHQHSQTELFTLPGSVNGKSTQLLSAKN